MRRSRSSKRRSRRSSTSSSGSMYRKASNVVVFKLVDPIVQALLFVLFLFALDTDFDISYKKIFNLIVGLQMLSCVANFMFNPPDLIKKERMAYLFIMVPYLIFYFYFQKKVPEYYIVARHGEEPSLPVHELIIGGGSIALAFWYNIICFREIKTMLKSFDPEEG